MKIRDAAADILESGEGFEHFHAVCFRDLGGQCGGDDGLHHCAFFRKSAGVLVTFKYIIHQQIAGLVSVQRDIAAVIGKQLYRETVGIGIGCHQQFCADLSAKLFAELKCLGIFRVRISDSCKVGIRISLFFHHVEVLESSFLHHL